MNSRKLLNNFLKLTVASAILFTFLNFASNSKYYGKVDFVQYYSASKLISFKKNPYHKENIEKVQDKLNNKYEYIYMYNPPQVFPLIYGLSFFDFEISSKIWMFFSIFLILLSLKFLFSTFNLKDRFSYYFLILFLVLFEPIYSILYYGQISFILLFSISLSIYFIQLAKVKCNSSYMYYAGVPLGLISIKPHILLLLIPLFFLSFSRNNFFKILIGLFTSISLLFIVSEIIFPGINYNYLSFIKTPPIFWKNPTLGSWVQQFIGIHSVYVRFIPTFLVFLAISLFSLLKNLKKKKVSNRDSFDLFLAYYPLCLLACPYFWIFDYAMLLPAIFYLTKKAEELSRFKERVLHIFLLGLCFCSFFRDESLGQEYYIYFPLIIFMITFYFYFLVNSKNN